jgi:hypothetical protein
MEAGLTNEREMRSYTATTSIAAESGCGSAVIVRQPFLESLVLCHAHWLHSLKSLFTTHYLLAQSYISLILHTGYAPKGPCGPSTISTRLT